MNAVKEEYILTISAGDVVSTDPDFTMENLGLGDGFRPLDTWFEDANGNKIRRERARNERKISNQTMPRLAFQIFESQLSALSPQEKAEYPTGQYEPGGKIHKGIYPTVEEFRKQFNSIEYLVYTCEDGSQFVIYAWNIFSTILFVKECLKRFGNGGDKFVLTYCGKSDEEKDNVSDEVIESSLTNEHDLNMILYGPPGTGKTYNSVNYAVAIIEGKKIDVITAENHADVLKRYNNYKDQGLIAFTTFHQSYGYEEFIEGIKPVVTSGEEIDGTNDIQYAVLSGIFKNFCEKAVRSKNINHIADYGLNGSPNVWKVSLEGTGDNPTRTECFENNHIRIGWDSYGKDITDETDFSSYGGKNPINAFVNRMRIGDVVLSCYSSTTIDAIGVVTGDYEWHDEYPRFKRLRPVKWIVKGIKENIMDITDGTTMTLPTVYRFSNIYLDDVLKIAEKYNVTEMKKSASKENYVFIIDEINRGNISKIFGELITLIEDTKRLGKPEETTAILPYSGKPFGVPDNVYILGTMNTADRSIAQIDTALRRRFSFVEMMPDTNILEGIEVEGVNIANMLDIINRRIEVLYDREHTIGHAFFTGLRTEPTIDKLATIFKKSIIPLLQEYFYEDYEKIRLVLGDNRKSEEAQFIVAKAHDYASLFGNVDIGLDDGYRYEINPKAFKKIEAYRSI